MFSFDNTYVRDLEGGYLAWPPSAAPEPALVRVNRELAAELGLDDAWLDSPDAVAVLSGSRVPEGAEPIAQAYSGHQFGMFSPVLGDGRAVLLGEVIGTDGRRRDVAFKGSGRTPFSRGGDGKAVLGPVIREYLLGEAMHALGIPTTRALAAATTGEQVHREMMLPGAVLTRVAASHLRVGTFEFAARRDLGLLRRLADYAIARHYPELAGWPDRYSALVQAVSARQAMLIAQWMSVGFIHGVMNTDNMTISGETIDYGPCAFVEAYDPKAVFSSIDHSGRYAFGNQPGIAQWNLTRFAESLVPLVAEQPSETGEPLGVDAAVTLLTEIVTAFVSQYDAAYGPLMAAKLGLAQVDPALITDFLELLHAHRVDFTSAFRRLTDAVPDDDAKGLHTLFAASSTHPDGPTSALDLWLGRWRDASGGSAVASDTEAQAERAERLARMQAVNPVYIPRNHLVENALAAAIDGDLKPFDDLLEVLADPFTERPGLGHFAEPAPAEVTACYRTYCGT